MANKIRNYLQFHRSFATLGNKPNKLKSIGVIGVPQNKGQTKLGVEEAPDVLRSSGLIDTLKNICGKRIIKDYGNLSYSTPDVQALENMKNWKDVFGCNVGLFNQVQTMLKENDQFLVLGGDHSIAVGSISGHLAHDPNLALIWIDAHADINLNKTSPSGNIHGMPVSFLLDEIQPFWRKQMNNCFKERISAKRLAYVGLRDIDPYESYLLQSLGITAFGMNAIDKHGISKITEMVFDKIDPGNNLNYHISFDIDSLDNKEAPSTGTPVPGGLTLREGIYIMEKFSDTGRVRGVDLVEVNPKIGNEADIKRTLTAATEILKAIFGHNRLGDIKEAELLQEFALLTRQD